MVGKGRAGCRPPTARALPGLPALLALLVLLVLLALLALILPAPPLLVLTLPR